MRQMEGEAVPTAGGSGRLDAVRRADPLLVALGLLTLVTGLVDAACYLGWAGCSLRT